MRFFRRRAASLVHVPVPAAVPPPVLQVIINSDRSKVRARPAPTEPVIVIPTDILFAAWRQLFPAERLVVFGARKDPRGFRVSSLIDVTGTEASRSHVRACRDKMSRSLVDLERTGAHLAVWMHSHPGSGIGATYPSPTDHAQQLDLRRHHASHLLGIVAVSDGWLRVFGHPETGRKPPVALIGRGIQRHPEDPCAFRLLGFS